MNKTVKKLVVSAVLIALAVVTSFIKLIDMPMGGAVTLLSMFFVTVVGYWYGLSWGIFSAIAYGILQFIVGGAQVYVIYGLILDYPLAFGALGLAGFGHRIKWKWSKGKFTFGGLQIGYLLGVLGRFFFSFISGWLVFGEYAPKGWNHAVYSLVYNGSYLGLEALITLIIISIPAVSKALINARNVV